MKPGMRVTHKWDGGLGTIIGVTPNAPDLAQARVEWSDGRVTVDSVGPLVRLKDQGAA